MLDSNQWLVFIWLLIEWIDISPILADLLPITHGYNYNYMISIDSNTASIHHAELDSDENEDDEIDDLLAELQADEIDEAELEAMLRDL